MTQLHSNHRPYRGRIFPELIMSQEELAREEVEKLQFYQRCLPIFDRLRPQFINQYYNWFIAIEPNSENYFIAQSSKAALLEALEKHPQAKFFTFCLNETGVSGRI